MGPQARAVCPPSAARAGSASCDAPDADPVGSSSHSAGARRAPISPPGRPAHSAGTRAMIGAAILRHRELIVRARQLRGQPAELVRGQRGRRRALPQLARGGGQQVLLLARALRPGQRAQRLGPPRTSGCKMGKPSHHRIPSEVSPRRLPDQAEGEPGGLIETMHAGAELRLSRSSRNHIGSVDSHALRMPARRAECSRMANASSPFHARPEHQFQAYPGLDNSPTGTETTVR